ncbi:hypothetical protein LCGC14_1234530 [marine sediment metagenome]|uniref:Uncharacterized protein n=1 Tax=marine sediment metagenome TaxID=412755 RepID=A0A0F9NPT2_9ZZZZ
MRWVCVSKTMKEAGHPIHPKAALVANCVQCGDECYLAPAARRAWRQAEAAGITPDAICMTCLGPEELERAFRERDFKVAPGTIQELIEVGLAQALEARTTERKN